MNRKEIEEIGTGLIEFAVPINLRAGLMRYFIDRIRTGDFLYAVLSNDLHGAFMRAADPSVEASLRSIVSFLTHYAPVDSWGSRKTVDAWLRRRAGMEGEAIAEIRALELAGEFGYDAGIVQALVRQFDGDTDAVRYLLNDCQRTKSNPRSALTAIELLKGAQL